MEILLISLQGFVLLLRFHIRECFHQTLETKVLLAKQVSVFLFKLFTAIEIAIEIACGF